MDHKTELHGALEAALGFILMTLPTWHDFVESTLGVAHGIGAIGGAIIAVHGVYRICEKRWIKK